MIEITKEPRCSAGSEGLLARWLTWNGSRCCSEPTTRKRTVFITTYDVWSVAPQGPTPHHLPFSAFPSRHPGRLGRWPLVTAKIPRKVECAPWRGGRLLRGRRARVGTGVPEVEFWPCSAPRTVELNAARNKSFSSRLCSTCRGGSSSPGCPGGRGR
jgi:hypothetical protein